jgi:hypothetical protein
VLVRRMADRRWEPASAVRARRQSASEMRQMRTSPKSEPSRLTDRGKPDVATQALGTLRQLHL